MATPIFKTGIDNEPGAEVRRKRRAVECPEPMLGFAIIESVLVETAIIDAEKNITRELYRARIVKTSPRFTAGYGAWFDTPFKAGDWILLKSRPQGLDIHGEEPGVTIMLPAKHAAININDIAAYLPASELEANPDVEPSVPGLAGEA